MTLMERIHRAASARSMTNNSYDGESASFEFDMDVVRDTDRKEKKGRRRSRQKVLSVGISDQCDSSHGDRQPHEMLHSMIEDGDDVESDCLLPCEDCKELDHSERSTKSFSLHSYSTNSSSGASSILPNRAVGLSLLIGVIGILSSTLFLGFGIENAVEEQEMLFQKLANGLSQQFNETWSDYVTAASWVYQACAFQEITRDQFAYVHHYLADSVKVQAVEWIPKVLHVDRQALEEEALLYFETRHPEIEYTGFTGLQPGDPTLQNSLYSLQYRSTQDFYYPIHLIEPINEMNSPLIGLDIVTSEMHHKAMQLALDAFQPVATEIYHRISPDNAWTDSTFIQLLHPGIPMPDMADQGPQDIAALVVRIDDIIKMATRYLPEDLSLFIYDSTRKNVEPEFVVAAEIYHEPADNGKRILYLDEISLAELVHETVKFIHITKIEFALRQWTIAFVPFDDNFFPDLRYIIVAGKFILVASLCVSLWILTNHRRTRTILEVKRKADMEKTAVIVRSARENAKAEQELNDYIAHEVRNPLAAAMSACTFVKSAVNEQNPFADEEAIKAVREDVEIIDSSLTFTHDLLRSMLDMHRAASKNLIIEETPLDVRRDVLEPVLAMLYKRNMRFEVSAECPKRMYIFSDRIRLKQILLNLFRNSARYVQKGYIKIGAEIVDGNVQLYVEDSGHGIAEERKKHLFSKFQESLNVMDQGSGVGLCLCKSMVNLLEGDIWLDEDFDSGVPGFPGSRFVIGLKKPPLPEEVVKETVTFCNENSDTSTTNEDTNSNPGGNGESLQAEAAVVPVEKRSPTVKRGSVGFTFDSSDPNAVPKASTSLVMPRANSNENFAVKVEDGPPALPEKISILFVDDDMILRKLFMRSVRKVIDTWDIQEAASGEAALKLMDDKEFDIIFMDQYMASVEKKLLGTETVRALRSKGVRSRICGLSANDVEDGFWKAGADCFMFKPFPCKKEQLQAELRRVLDVSRHPKLDALVTETQPRDGSESNSLFTQSTMAAEESKGLNRQLLDQE